MKKVYILLYIIILISLSSFVNATLTDGLMFYYSGDNVNTDSLKIYNITTYKNITYVSGKNNQAFNTSNKYPDFQIQNGYNLNKGDSFSAVGWFYVNGSASKSDIFIDAGGNIGFGIGQVLGAFGVTGKLSCGRYSGSWSSVNTTSNVPINTWFFGACIKNASTGVWQIWLNGTNEMNSTLNNATSILNNFSMYGYASTYRTEGDELRIDEFGYWNRSLSANEISNLYNSGTGLFYPFTSFSISINATNPTNNTNIFNGTMQQFNFSMNSNNDSLVNYCYLGLNTTSAYPNVSQINNPISNYTYSINYSINGTGNYLWQIRCGNGTNDVNSTRYQINTYYLDQSVFNITCYDLNDSSQINSITVYDNITDSYDTGSSVQKYFKNFINLTSLSVNQTFIGSDNTYQHQNTTFVLNISLNNVSQRCYMQPNQLTLNFSASTTGVYIDTTKTKNFTTTNIFFNAQNVSTGAVSIRFNFNGWFDHNYTQYYEYINDGTLNVAENLWVLTGTKNWNSWFQTMDYTGAPIENVYIRMYGEDPALGTIEKFYDMKLISQRTTDSDGYTQLYGVLGTSTKIYAFKSGYEPVTLIGALDAQYSQASPFQIIMKNTNENGTDSTWVYTPTSYSNLSKDIYGTIFSLIYKNSVTINTDYRIFKGMGQKKLVLKGNDEGFYDFTLTKGNDYNNITPTNITLFIYINNKTWGNRTIVYDNTTKTKLFSEGTAYDKNLITPLIAVLIVLLSYGLGFLFKNENVTITAFKWLCIIVSIVETSFISLAIIIMIQFMIKFGVRKLIQE